MIGFRFKSFIYCVCLGNGSWCCESVSVWSSIPRCRIWLWSVFFSIQDPLRLSIIIFFKSESRDEIVSGFRSRLQICFRRIELEWIHCVWIRSLKWVTCTYLKSGSVGERKTFNLGNVTHFNAKLMPNLGVPVINYLGLWSGSAWRPLCKQKTQDLRHWTWTWNFCYVCYSHEIGIFNYNNKLIFNDFWD